MMKKIVSPVLGLAFVVFIPLIGIGMALWLLATHAFKWASGAVTEAERVASPTWEASTAYLGRSTPAKPGDVEDAKPDAWKQDVEKKLNETTRDRS